MPILAFANQKGGCGKTTTTRNVAKALHERGKRVLMCDLDQQGSLTAYCGVNPETLEQTIYNIFASYIDLYADPLPLDPIVHQIEPGLDLIPANEELAALDIELINAMQREEILRMMLMPLLARYDYILFDCPPALSLLVVNALVAADAVIIVLQADYLATRGVNRLLKLMQAIRTRLNPRLVVDGILLTMADMRTRHAKEIIERTRVNFKDKILVFSTITKIYAPLKDTPIVGKSILELDGASAAAQSFRDLAEQIETLHTPAQAAIQGA